MPIVVTFEGEEFYFEDKPKFRQSSIEKMVQNYLVNSGPSSLHSYEKLWDENAIRKMMTVLRYGLDMSQEECTAEYHKALDFLLDEDSCRLDAELAVRRKLSLQNFDLVMMSLSEPSSNLQLESIKYSFAIFKLRVPAYIGDEKYLVADPSTFRDALRGVCEDRFATFPEAIGKIKDFKDQTFDTSKGFKYAFGIAKFYGRGDFLYMTDFVRYDFSKNQIALGNFAEVRSLSWSDTNLRTDRIAETSGGIFTADVEALCRSAGTKIVEGPAPISPYRR